MIWIIACPSGIITWLALFPLRAYLVRSKVLDMPNERSLHVCPTPRGGGLVLVPVVLAGWLLYGLLTAADSKILAIYALTAAMIAFISWLDDLRSSPVVLRFLVHSVAAVIAMAGFGRWDQIAIPFIGDLQLGWLGTPITFLWIVGLTNAYNFMDGIDGIAGSQAVVAGFGWAAVGWLTNLPLVCVLGILLAASSFGFLLHNWSPARIFVGDVGSAFLGFSFALLPLMMTYLSPDTVASRRAPLLGVLMVWPFVFDTLFTICRRLWLRENIFRSHRSHIYQRIVGAGLSHRQVTVLYAALALVGVVFALVYAATAA